MGKDPKVFFSRSSLLTWGPVLLGIFLVQVIFGWNDDLAGMAWRVIPIVVGLTTCITFLWLGRFLSTRMSWPYKLLVLAAISLVLVSVIFTLLVVTTAQDPAKEFERFLPGQTVFFLILFFSALLTALGFVRGKPKQPN